MSKTPSWSEKKALLLSLENTSDALQGINDSLMKGTTLKAYEEKVGGLVRCFLLLCKHARLFLPIAIARSLVLTRFLLSPFAPSAVSLTTTTKKLYSSVESLDDKKEELKKAMAAHVENGKITKEEKSMLIQQVEQKIETLTSNLDAARKAGQGKKVEKITELLKKANTRRETLEGISVDFCPPLKAEPQIAKLRKELIPLMRIEAKAKVSGN